MEAGDGEIGVALVIALMGRSGPVILKAVELDDQARFAPEAIDDVAGEEDVGRRGRDTVLLAQLEEATLELGANVGRDGMSGEDGGKQTTPMPTV